LSTNQIANFLATPGIRNILGRIVGGDPSVIHGLIQVTGGQSNLYLMNPAGIVFGSTARLNVPASFTATTATGIGFGNGGWLGVLGRSDYASLTGVPNAFAFATPQPGAIVNAANLAVNPGQSLTLLGGTVVNTGQLLAPGGEITIAAVPGETLVRLSQQGGLLSLEFSPSNSLAFSNALPFTPLSLPQLLTGGNLNNATGLTVNPDGVVQLTGSRVPISTIPGTAIASGTVSIASTFSPTASQINILGDRVSLLSANLDASGTNGGGTIRIGGDYRGQGTVPNASNTFVSPDSSIRADARQAGNGGRVIIWADKTARFHGTLSAQGGIEGGNGGFVEISGKQTLDFNGQVNTGAVRGNLGTLLLDPTDFTIDATNVNAINAATATVTLDASHNITFNAPIAMRAQGAGLTAIAGNHIQSNVAITTNGGKVTLTAGGRASVSNINTSPTLNGTSGDISLSAGGDITTGEISTSTESTSGSPSGDISITSRRGAINTSAGVLDSRFGGGNGGSITLTAQGNITTGLVLSNMRFGGTGVVGDITLTSRDGAITSTARLDAGTTNGKAGNVTLTAQNRISAADIRSYAVNGGTGDSGDVSLTSNTGNIRVGPIRTGADKGDGGDVVLNSQQNIQVAFINAQGGVNGSGGNVDVTTSRLFRANSTFSDRNGLQASISTAGGRSGGEITIEHGGGAQNIPFQVGDSITNGTAGAITTGSNNSIRPDRSFPGTYIQGKSPSIQIQTQDEPLRFENSPPTPLDLVPPLNGKSDGLLPEEISTRPIQSALNLPPEDIKTAAQIQAELSAIEQAIGVKPALIYAFFVPESLSQASNPTALLPDPTVLEMTEQESDELVLILVTATNKIVSRRVAGATRAKVLPAAETWIRDINNLRPRARYLANAQQLYRWLVAPLEPELAQEQIQNLVFIVDRKLRSLPFAALHNGQQFLVERYSVGLMPSMSLTDTRYVDIRDVRVLAMGSERFEQQQPLPYVPIELTAVVRDLWDGALFANESFTFEKLVRQREQRRFGVVHLATHAEFDSEDANRSYIQLWNEQLTFERLRSLNLNRPPVELMVLSACQTALGDELTELGFAGLALQLGAKSSLASLWYVNDAATFTLMARFYQQLKQIPYKAEALRQAQLEMLQQERNSLIPLLTELRASGILATLPGNNDADDRPVPTAQPTLAQSETRIIKLLEGLESRNLSHPYYWAGFTLVGNPW
jgi:filamentous hemagglutinin family protein